MPTPAETFQKASFNGIAFPIYRVTVKGGLRHHIHEFPHSPGGEIEKMGRKLYSITMSAFFHDIPLSPMAEDYPDLYPERLFSLQSAFEQELTAPLVIPNLGTLNCVAIDWRRTFDFTQSLSGESVELEFIEDQDRETIFEAVEFGPGSLKEKTYQLYGLVENSPHNFPSIFQTINDIVTSIEAIEGIADATSKVLEAKLLQVADLCERASRITELQSPENWAIHRALKAVWLAARDLAEDILGRQSPIHTWRVPRVMSAAEASTAIYRSAEHAIELIQLNPIEDAFAIPEGFNLRYYRAAA